MVIPKMDSEGTHPQFHECLKKEHIDRLEEMFSNFILAMEERDKSHQQDVKECNKRLFEIEKELIERRYGNGVQDSKIQKTEECLEEQDNIVTDLLISVKTLNLLAKVNALLLVIFTGAVAALFSKLLGLI